MADKESDDGPELLSLEGRAFPTEDQEMRVVQRANWLPLMQAFTRRALAEGQFFTHSNRLVDARVTSAVSAGYAENGDTAAHLAGADKLIDIYGSAGDSKKFKVLMAEYVLDGQVTSLADAVLKGRPAGKLLAGAFDGVVKPVRFDSLDKAVLMPVQDEREYVALLPKTPAFLYPALLSAAKAVGLEHARGVLKDMAEKGDLKASEIPKVIPVRMRARATKLSKAQNFSYWLNRIAGQIIQPIFIPPSKPLTDDRRIALMVRRWAKEGQFPFSMLKRELTAAIEETGFHAVIAHERHRHGQTGAVDNATSREAYRMLGYVTAERLRSILGAMDLSGHPKLDEARREILTARQETGWYQDIENRLFEKIADAYRLVDGRKLFSKGFFASVMSTELSQPTTARTLHTTDQTNEGRFLVIRLSASDVDIGSNGISIGLPSITAIHGLLHNVLERQLNLQVKRFCPAFSCVVMNDTLARQSTSRVAIWEKEIKSVLREEQQIAPSMLSLGMGASAMNGRSAVNGRVGAKDKAIAQPFNNDVKGSIEMSVLVELRGALDAQAGADVAERLPVLLAGARLAGGPINEAACRVREELPRLRGFALERVELDPYENPFEAIFRSVSFANREYLGTVPIGAVQTGYECLGEAESVRRNGQVWPALHAESLYTTFKFVRADNESRQWFRLKFRDDNDRTITLC